MKEEAVAKIIKTLTPEVTIKEAYDTDDGIIVQVVHSYRYPQEPNKPSLAWRKMLRVAADKDGNVLSVQGLF